MSLKRFPDPLVQWADVDETTLRDAFARLNNNNDFKLFTSLINGLLDNVEGEIDILTGVELERAAAKRGMLNKIVDDFYEIIEDSIRPQDVKEEGDY